MGVASGCVVRRYIDFIILLIPTPLVYICSFLKCFLYMYHIASGSFSLGKNFSKLKSNVLRQQFIRYISPPESTHIRAHTEYNYYYYKFNSRKMSKVKFLPPRPSGEFGLTFSLANITRYMVPQL